MIVGICQIDLHIPNNHSLKEKRSIVRSIVTRIRQQFNVSIVELDLQDVWQSSCLGVACISNDSAYAHRQLENIVHWIEQKRPDVTLVDYRIELC
ncbi:MAG: DUF503 domain-containing protein [Chloroflexia bacterium]|nr:DUF503 domain-containing protein [Chloroflexia bacterium]